MLQKIPQHSKESVQRLLREVMKKSLHEEIGSVRYECIMESVDAGLSTGLSGIPDDLLIVARDLLVAYAKPGDKMENARLTPEIWGLREGFLKERRRVKKKRQMRKEDGSSVGASAAIEPPKRTSRKQNRQE